MNIETLVPSLEQCQQIAKHWPGDIKTVFLWCVSPNGATVVPFDEMDFVNTFYPAPTLAEFINLVKSHDIGLIDSNRLKIGNLFIDWVVVETNPVEFPTFTLEGQFEE